MKAVGEVGQLKQEVTQGNRAMGNVFGERFFVLWVLRILLLKVKDFVVEELAVYVTE